MAGQRRKRQTANPLLLRRAVSRMGRMKPPFLGGSTLYDVHEPRAGITVLPSIARDSQLVHIMQSSLSSNLRSSRSTRSRRTSRVIPNRARDRPQTVEQPTKAIRSVSQSWQRSKPNAMLSDQSVKRSDRSRASSIGYPSSWNYEISKEENGLDRDYPNEDSEIEILQQFKAPRPKSTDTSVQCKIKVHKKQRNKILAPKVCCVAQTQTGPLENSLLNQRTIGSQESDKSHNCSESSCCSRSEEEAQRQRVYSGGETVTQSSLICLCTKVPKQKSSGSKCNKETCPYKSKNGKNYGGYSPSETSYEENSNAGDKPSDVFERSSERLNRIEKLSSPPSETVCKGKSSKNSPRSATKGRSESEEPNVNSRSPRSESSNGNWRLHLASKHEIASYQLSEDVNLCPEVCSKRKGLSDPNEFQDMEQTNGRNSKKNGLSDPNEFQEMKQTNEQNSSVGQLGQKGNSSSQYGRDYQQELASTKDMELICRCDNPEKSLRKRNVGFKEKQSSKQSSNDIDDQSKANKSYKSRPCRCANADKQTQRQGAVDITKTSKRNNYKAASLSDSESKEESCDCDCSGCMKRTTETPKESRRQKDEINAECMCSCPVCERHRTRTQKSSRPSTTMPKIEDLNSRNDNMSSRRKTMHDDQGEPKKTYPSKPCKCVNADTQTLRHGTREMHKSRERNSSPKSSNYDSNYTAASLGELESLGEICDCDCPGCMKGATETTKNGKRQKDQLNAVCRCKCPVCERQRTQSQKSSRPPTTMPQNDNLSSSKVREMAFKAGSPRKPDKSSIRQSYSPDSSRLHGESESKRDSCECDCPGCIKRATEVANKSGRPGDEANPICNCNCPVCEQFRAQTLKSSRSRNDGMNSTNSRSNARSSSRNSYSYKYPRIAEKSSTKKSFKESDLNSSKKSFNGEIPREAELSSSKKTSSAKNPRDNHLSSGKKSNSADNWNSRNYGRESRKSQYNTDYTRPIVCNCQYSGYQGAQGNDHFGWNRNPPWRNFGFCQCNRPGCTKAAIHRDIPYNYKNISEKHVNGSSKKRDSSVQFACKCCPATTQTSQSDLLLIQDVCSDEECDLQCDSCRLAVQEANQSSEDPPSYCACSTSSSNSSSELESDADSETAIIPKQESGDAINSASSKDDSDKESEKNIETKNKEVQCSCNCPHCGVLLNEFPEKDRKDLSRTKPGSQRKPTARGTAISKEAPKRSSPMPKAPKEKPKTKAESSQKEPKTKIVNSKKEPKKKPMNKTGQSREEPITKVEKESLSKQKASVNSEMPRKSASLQADSKPTDSEMSPEIVNFCNNDTCTNNICGQCTITPAKTNAGDVMVNMVIDEKCNVNQIIEILHETVAGLEQQKKLLSQAAAGNPTLKKMQWNPNENNNNSNGKLSDSTNNNSLNNANNLNPVDNSGYYMNEPSDKFSMPKSDGQQEFANSCNDKTCPNGSFNKKASQQEQQEIQNSCNNRTCPYGSFNKQVPQEHEPHSAQPEQNNNNGNRDHTNESSRGVGKSANVRIVTETQYDYPEANEQETNNRNYDDGYDCDEECCPSQNNNPGVWLKRSKNRKRSGSSYPFDDDAKKCPSLTYSEFKRKTLEHFKPTNSFLQLFDLTLVMQKNRQSIRNNALSCKFPNRKSQNLTQMVYNEHCLKSREHYEYLANKNAKYIDTPKGPTSYEINILKGFEKQKADCKETKTNIKCKIPCPCEKATDDEESSEDVDNCPCQLEDPFETEELCRRQTDILYRERKKLRSSLRQRKQSEQTDLSTSCSDVPRDSSACGLAFCRGRGEKQIESSRKHSNQCGCDYDEDFHTRRKGKDKRLRQQTRLSNLYRCSPYYSSDSSDSRLVNSLGKGKGPRRNPEENVNRERNENKLNRNKCLCVSGENNSVKGVSELKPGCHTQAEDLIQETSEPEYTKYSHKIYNWTEAETPRDLSLKHPVDIDNKQKPIRKPSIFSCFKKATKTKTDLSLFPASKPSEALQKRDKKKQSPLDLKNTESKPSEHSSQRKPSNLKSPEPEPSKELQKEKKPNRAMLEMRESPKKAEPNPSKNLEKDDKPKSKSSSFFPCFNKPNEEKSGSKERPKKPEPKPSEDVEVGKQNSSRLCFKKTIEKPKKPSPKTSEDPGKEEKPFKGKQEKKDIAKKAEDFEKEKIFACFVRTNKEKNEKLKDPEPKQSEDNKSVQKPKPKSSNRAKKENLKKAESKRFEDIERDGKPKENENITNNANSQLEKTSEDHKQKENPKEKSAGLFPCFKRNKRATKQRLRDPSDYPEPKRSGEQEDGPKKRSSHEENEEGKLQESEFEQVDSSQEYCECDDEVKVFYYSSYNPADAAPECCECVDDEVKVLYDSSYKFCKNRNGDTNKNDPNTNKDEKVNLPHERPNHFFSMLK